MKIIVEEAVTEEKCLKKIHKKFGEKIEITSIHHKEISGFLSLFAKEKCIISFRLIKNKDVSGDTKTLDEKQTAFLINSHAQRIKNNTQNNTDEDKNKSAEKENYKELTALIKDLAEKVGTQSQGSETEHVNIKKIISLMEDNDFSFGFINKIISRIKTELNLAELEDISTLRKKVIDFIADSISIKPFSNIIEKPVIMLIGPTGVGKTTSLAKLAAFYSSKMPEKLDRDIKVKVITTDMYRIGAAEQMRKYCDVMGIQLVEIDFLKDLPINIDLCKTSGDVVLVDTTGRSPNDSVHIEEMQSYFSSINKNETEIHLVLSAVTKISDIRQIMESYKVFDYNFVTITKLDETLHIGNIVSILSETNLPVSYITTGQGVPKDIVSANKKIFLKKLKGFEEDFDYINKNYDDSSSIVWG